MLSYFLLVFLFANVISLDAKNIDFNAITSDKLSSNKSIMYSLTIPNSTSQQNLFFIAQPLNSTDSPNMTISRGTDIWYCNKQVLTELCVLPSILFSSGDIIQIQLSCQTDCSYEFYAYQSSPYNITVNASLSVQFEGNGYGIALNIAIPNDLNFTDLGIVATINNIDRVESGLYMIANVGTNLTTPNSSTLNYTSRSTWEYGAGIFLSRAQINQNQTIKILLYGPAHMKVQVKSIIRNGNQQTIKTGSETNGYVLMDNQEVYVLNLTDPTNNYTGNEILEFKFTKYYGVADIVVSNTVSMVAQDIQKVIDQSQTTFILTPKILKQLNFTDSLYIVIRGMTDCTYTITSTINSQSFVLLKDGIIQASELDGQQIDNYLYVLRVNKDSLKGNKKFELKASITSSVLSFEIKRCYSYQQNQSLTCLYNNTDQIIKDQPQFANFQKGKYQNYGRMAYFTFQYNPLNCYTVDNLTYVCVFQVVCFKDKSIKQITNYNIQLKQTSFEMPLESGVSKRERVEQDDLKNYRLEIKDTRNVSKIKFAINVISGDAILFVSNTTSNPSFQTPDAKFTQSQLIVSQNFTTVYYLTVKGFEISYYTITALVVYKQQPPLVSLSEGETYSVFKSKTQQKSSFYIATKLNSLKIEVIPVYGSIRFEVKGATNHSVDPNKASFFPTGNTIYIQHLISEQYIVNVYSTDDTQFSIVFKRPLECSVYMLSSPLVLPLNPNDQVCYRYILNKLQDIEIELSTPTYQLTMSFINISISVNSTNQTLVSRSTRLERSQLQAFCPEFNMNNVVHDINCVLQLNIKASESFYLIVAVQYIQDSLVMMDGYLQKVHQNLSKTKSKHLYYEIFTMDTIQLFLRSQSDTQYILLAKLVEASDLMISQEDTIYPKTINESTYFAQSNVLGFTSLVIPSTQLVQDIVKSNCISCYLLISIYTKSQTQQQCNFKISLTQSSISAYIGSSFEDYIQKDITKRYKMFIPTINSTTSILVTINTLVDQCTNLNVFQLDANTEKVIANTSQNQLEFNVSNDRTYIVEVQGLLSCYFEIVFANPKDNVQEIKLSNPVKVVIDANISQYFLYYNTKNQSFRVISMADFGESLMEAAVFTRTDFPALQQIIESLNTNSENLLYSYNRSRGTLEIKMDTENFCTDCYFLIKVSALSNTSADIMIMADSNPVPIKINKVYQDMLLNQEQIQYVYYSITTFNVSIEILYGSIQVDISKGGLDTPTSLLSKNLSSKSIFNIPHSKQNQNDFTELYDKNSEYIITIKGQSTSGYALSIFELESKVRIKSGVPFDFRLLKDQFMCIQFLSGISAGSMFIQMEMESTAGFKYYVKCLNQGNIDCPQSVLIDETRSDQNINIQVSARRATYYFCMQSAKDLNLSLVVSFQDIKYLKVNSQMLVKSSNTTVPAYYSMYNPNRSNIMIQIFQCSGSVQLSASQHYQDLFVRNSSMIIEHTKTAGHYIATADTPASGLYYLQSRATKENTTYLLKYSYYQHNPYKNLMAVDGLDVEYQLTRDSLVLAINRITQLDNSYFNIQKVTYRIYISNDIDVLRQASQCSLASVYNKSVTFDSLDTSQQISVSIDYGQLDDIIYTSDYFYAVAVCEIQLIPQYSHFNDFFRIIYNQVKLTSVSAAIEENSSGTVVAFFLFWIVIPGITGTLFFLCALKFCLRYFINPPTHQQLIDEEPSSSKEVQSGTMSAGIKIEEPIKQEV